MRKNLSFLPTVNSSSFANKYGISMKENNSLGSMGLNPNLNIEDQYIENLLKQIHFMNMEIKLMKEKQINSDSNALWGMINRTNQPVVTNIVQSSQKYQDMKKQNDATLYKLEKDIARLENDQGALLNELKFLENKKAQILTKTKQWEESCASKHTVLDEKIQNWTAKLKHTQEQLERQRKKFNELSESQGKIIFQDESDKAKTDKENLQIKNDELIEEMMEQDITNRIEILKKLTADIEKVFEDDMEYLRVKEDNKALKEKIANIEKNIAGANFEILQLNESFKMAELEREKEIRERKLLTEQYEEKKTMLNEILELNRVRKEKQTLNQRSQSIQISRAEEQSVKLQKNLQQIKKKLLKNEEINCSLSNQIWKYERQIQLLKDNKKKITDTIMQIKSANEVSDSQLVKLRNQLAIMEDQYEKTLNTETNTSLDLFELERELQYLRGRKELLTKSIELKEVMNKLNIEDLHKVVQKNNDLNSTVASLMSKWDQIKTFSRI